MANLKISRILHAGYVFEYQSQRVVFDPIFENPFSGNCFAFPDVAFKPAEIRNTIFDAVFISHYHDDHCSFESLDLIDRSTPIYMFCLYEEMFELLRELGFKNVFSLEIDNPVKVGEFEVIPRMALDMDVDSIFQIRVDNKNILNMVDSWMGPSTLKQLSNFGWDLVLWPFQTMREIEVLIPTRAAPADLRPPDEWEEPLQTLNPKYIVPSSCQFQMEKWSWYNKAFFPITYRAFSSWAQEILPNTQVLRLDPSKSVQFVGDELKAADPLPWMTPPKNQGDDYTYAPQAKIPTTAEIAKKIKGPRDGIYSVVNDYCENQLTQRYSSLAHLSESYFAKPQQWRLTVFDPEGRPRDFFYSIHGSNIELLPYQKGELTWVTEIPTVKLFLALTEGETLTSLYIRINDHYFSSEVEAALADADPLEDPLIRCLYDGVFAQYQKAQLKRIKERLSNL